FYNGGYDLPSGIELYAFGGFGRRAGTSAGFFRRADDDRTVRALWPGGFLPLINSTIYDLSTTAGVRGTVAGVRYDLSSGIGGNSFRFDVDNSNNVSLGSASPRNFYAGTLVYRQWSNTLDLAREFTLGASGIALRATAGAEYRHDGYRIQQGELASYVAGDSAIRDANGVARTTKDASGNVIPLKGAPGSQVFPGFTPGDAGGHGRTNTAVYAGLESDLTRQLLVSGALRYEHYSDFGGTTTAQLASRYTVRRGLVIRGAYNTGFRAPSLQQSYYSATGTNFVNGVPFDIKTAPVGSAIAQVLGATPLTPEHSRNYSAGVALEPLRRLALTVDGYRIDITDRIVLSENFTGPAVAAVLRPFNTTAARYFTNAIDTRTTGIDVVGNYGVSLRSAGFLTLTGGYNHNRTHATVVKQTPAALGNQSETLFGRVERSRIEEGQPRDNVLASATYELRRFTAVLRTQRFGSVVSRSTVDSLDQTFGAKWVSDVSASYRPVPRLTLSVGADNVLDVYPDQNNKLGNPRFGSVGVAGPSGFSGNSNYGIFPYNQFSPFGFNGRFVYVRASVGL
nr:TonB-dependent receptor [Candidatus Eremiobacteraeota bacterium]